MKTAIFSIDLSDYDILGYEQNPIVTHEFDYNGLPIGKAKIAPDKKSVEVTFLLENKLAEKLLDSPEAFELVTAYVDKVDNSGKDLLDLSMVTRRKAQK